jgi:hypothetical protein
MCTDLESVDLPATRGQEALQPTATLVSLTDENVGDIGPFFCRAPSREVSAPKSFRASRILGDKSVVHNLVPIQRD